MKAQIATSTNGIETVRQRSQVQIVEFHMMNKYRYFPLAMTSGFVVRTILYPFTLVKTRLQVQRRTAKGAYSGTLDAFRRIARADGITGLYRGFWVSNVSVVSQLLYVTTYEYARHHLATHRKMTDKRRRAFIAGGCASVAAQTVVVPIDIISQHLQMLSVSARTKMPEGMAINSEHSHSALQQQKVISAGERVLDQRLIPGWTEVRANCVEGAGKGASANTDKAVPVAHKSDLCKLGSVRHVVVALYRNDGVVRGFYRGYLVSVMTYAPGSALWWLFYDTYCDILASFLPAESPHLVLQCIAGPLAGSSSVLLTTPMDAIRARIQVERSQFVATARSLWSEERLRIFTKGLTPRLVQSVVTSFFVVLGYETIKRLSVLDEYKHVVRW